MNKMVTVEEETGRAWIEHAKATLDEWDHALDELQAQIDASRSELRADLRARLDAARRSAADARKKWEQVKDDTGGVLDSVGTEVSTAWDANKTALERSLEQIRSALR